jgi:hypothetical protein
VHSSLPLWQGKSSTLSTHTQINLSRSHVTLPFTSVALLLLFALLSKQDVPQISDIWWQEPTMSPFKKSGGYVQCTLYTGTVQYYLRRETLQLFGLGHGLINYIDTKAKCQHLEQLTCKGPLQQVIIFLRPPPLLGFLGWFSNFVGSESCHIQSIKLLQNMVSNRTQHPQPPSSHTLSVYTVLWHREGRVAPERRLEGQQFTKLGRKYQHDCIYSQL